MPVIDGKNKRAGNDFSAFNVALGLLLAAIIANYLMWVWHFAAPVPVADDYVLILTRLITFRNLTHGQDLGFFFDLFDVHRLVFAGFIIVAFYKIIGNIDFHTLILIGNCSFLALLWGIWKYAGSSQPVAANRIGYFLPVALLVLSPAYFESSLWATGVLGNPPVLMFAFFAVAYAAQRSGFAFLAAILAGLLASGVTANGMVVLLACAAVFASQRRFIRALLMATLFITVAWAYTQGFPSDHSSFGEPITKSAGGLIRFFLALCGSIVWGENGAILLGALLVAGFGVLTWRGLPKRNPALWGFGFFLLLSMVMMSVGRVGSGLEAAQVSRYKLYSGLMLAVIYLGTLILVPSVAWKRTIGFFGILISCGSFVSYLIHYDAAITNFGFHPKLRMAYRSIEGEVQVVSGFPGTDFANHVIDTSERYGIYRPPAFSELVLMPAPLHERATPSIAKQQDQEGYDPHVYEFIDGEKAALVYGIIDEKCASKPFLLVLKNDARTLYFAMQPPDWGWLNIYPFRSAYGFFGGIVDKRSLPAGSYQLGLTCGDTAPAFLGNSYRVSKNL